MRGSNQLTNERIMAIKSTTQQNQKRVPSLNPFHQINEYYVVS